MALAALGQPEPLQALLAAWRQRTDVPQPLIQRMALVADPALRYRLPTVALGESALSEPTAGRQIEASLLAGYETNLDRSPRLDELTITFPGGDIVLPVVDSERRGRAVLLNLSGQWWRALGSRWALRGGGAMAGRMSSSHGDTDWQQYQLGATLSYAGRRWRSQFELAGAWVRGPLGEPFHQQRATWLLEHAWQPCRLRAGAEYEARSHSRTRSLDAHYAGGVLGLQCAAGGRWSAGLLWRGGRDTPEAPGRPGGEQRIRTLAAVLRAALDEGGSFELNWRASRSRDALGYSELLENGAVRAMQLHQLSLELALPAGPPGLQWLAQVQAGVQRSNLALFGYRAQSLYTGLRQQW